MQIGELIVAAGPDKGTKFGIEDGGIYPMGRGTDAKFQLSDPRASRLHCRFEADAGAVRLIDAGSKGGSFVNGKSVSTHTLRPGDTIRIGETELRFQVLGANSETVTGVQPPTGTKSGPPASAQKMTDLIGQKLSHYEIKRVVAEGSSGTIFFAHDAEHTRAVALKVLFPEFSKDEEQMQRFIRAMKTMMPLQQANLVRLFGAGKSGPFCWIAMEYVDGSNLAKVIDDIGTAGMLDWTYAFKVCYSVGLALEEAYKHQILHRNITPTNILIRSNDKVVKLGDMMLAKALEGTMAEQVTRPGQLVGEMAYMSPERTRSAAEVDTRSDIYSLGATAYALLTGRPPFEAKSLPDLIVKIRSGEVVKPKKFQLSIPDMFEGVVLRMLAKKPEDRFATPTALISDLERVAKFQGMTI